MYFGDLVAYELAVEKLQPRFEMGDYRTQDVEAQIVMVCHLQPEVARKAVDEAVAAIIYERSRQLINNRVLSRALVEARRHLTLSEADKLIYKALLDAEEDGEECQE